MGDQDKTDISNRAKITWAIQQAMTAANVGFEELASRIGKSWPQTEMMVRGDNPLVMEDFIVIAAALGMSASQLLTIAEKGPRERKIDQ
jgi:hypothetical protein